MDIPEELRTEQMLNNLRAIESKMESEEIESVRGGEDVSDRE